MKGAERKFQEKWEIARWLAWHELLLSPNIKPANKPHTAQAFHCFPWEQPTDDELKEKARNYSVSQEEIEELNRIFAEIEKQQNE